MRLRLRTRNTMRAITMTTRMQHKPAGNPLYPYMLVKLTPCRGCRCRKRWQCFVGQRPAEWVDPAQGPVAHLAIGWSLPAAVMRRKVLAPDPRSTTGPTVHNAPPLGGLRSQSTACAAT